MSSAISMPCARAPLRPVGGNRLERAELADGSTCVRPRRRRSPTGCPDRPAPATSALLRPLRLVRADRMDRRQVQHVESHLGDFGQHALRQSRNVPWPSPRGGRARKHFVPRARTRRAAARPRSAARARTCCEAPVRMALGERRERLVQRLGAPLDRIAVPRRARAPVAQRLASAPRARRAMSRNSAAPTCNATARRQRPSSARDRGARSGTRRATRVTVNS